MAAVSCEVCAQVASRYKCPTCRVRYCSVGCYRGHKTSGCRATDVSLVQKTTLRPTPTNVPEPLQLPEDEQGDLIPTAVLAALQHNTALRRQLRNPHLRELLDAIDASATPADEVQRAMRLPIFVDFADECMRHCYPSSEEQQR